MLYEVITLVETGLGVSVVPQSFQRLRWGRVVYRPITPARKTGIHLCLAGQPSAPSGNLLAMAAEM